MVDDNCSATWWAATEATKFARGECDSSKGICERNSWGRYEERNLEVEDCSPRDEYGGWERTQQHMMAFFDGLAIGTNPENGNTEEQDENLVG
jgi:hypothetical protein